jgi:ATP-binding cassette subfamily B protein
MENGRIVQRGTHDELVAEEGLYTHLWRVQAGLLDDLPADFVERAADRTATVRSGR